MDYRVRILLQQSTVIDLRRQLQEIEKQLKPLQVSANIDKASQKELRTMQSQMQKAINDTEAKMARASFNQIKRREAEARQEAKILNAVADRRYAESQRQAKQQEQTAQRQIQQQERVARQESARQERSAERERRNAQNYEQWWQRALRSREAQEQRIAQRSALDPAKMQNTLTALQNSVNKMTSGSASRFLDPSKLEAINNAITRLQNNYVNMSRPQIVNNIGHIRNQISELNGAAQNAARSSLNLGNALYQAMIKFPLWMGVSTIFMQFFHTIRDGIQYIHQFDDALIELQKVTEFTKETYDSMTQSAITMGKELGKSSVDIMRAYAEFGRVAKNKADIEELARVSAMASNVTSMTAETAAKAINTTMIAFKVNAKDSMTILNMWNELQNNYRVSAEDMAEAIGKVGAVANTTGMSMSKLNAITATLTGVTGLSGSEIGTMEKTLLSRIFRIGAEGEEDAGKAEEELNKLGIAVRKSNSEFRDAEDILDDVAKKYKTLTNVQQTNLAQVLGGTYHYAKVSALMENYDTVIEANIKALNSQGSAYRENQKYLDSITGRLNIFKTTMESQFSKAISSDLFKNIISSATVLIARLGDLKNIILVVGSAFLMWKGANITTWLSGVSRSAMATNLSLATINTTLKTLGISLKGLFTSNPLGLIALGITSVIEVMNLMNKTEEETRSNIKQGNEAFEARQQSISSLTKAYEEITKSGKTDDFTKQQLINTETQLKEALGETGKALDLQNSKFETNINLIKKSTQAELDSYIKVNELRIKALKETSGKEKSRAFGFGFWDIGFRNIDDVISRLGVKATGETTGQTKLFSFSDEEYLKELESIVNRRDELLKKGVSTSDLNVIANEYEKVKNTIKETADAEEQLNAKRKQYTENTISELENLSSKQRDIYEVAKQNIDFSNINQYSEDIKKVISIIQSFTGSNIDTIRVKLGNLFPSKNIDNVVNALKRASDGYYLSGETATQAEEKQKKLDDAYKNIIDNIQLLQKAQNELNEEHKFSESTLEGLEKKYGGLLDTRKSEKELLNDINKLIDNERENFQKSIEAKLEINNEWFNSAIKGNSELWGEISKAYGSDVNNFKNIADAKLEIDNFLRQQIAEGWGTLYNSQIITIEQMMDAASTLTETIGNQTRSLDDYQEAMMASTTLQMGGMSEEEIGRQSDRIIAMKNAVQKMKDVANNASRSIQSGVGKLGELKSGKKQEPDRAEVQSNEKLIEKELYSDVNNEIQKYNSLVGASEGIVKNTKDLKLQNSELKNQIDLYRGLQSAIHSKAEVARDERANIVGKLRGYGMGFQFTGTGDTMTLDNASTAIEKQRKIVNSLKDYKKNADKDVYMAQKQKLEDMERLSQRFFDIQNKDLFEYKNQWNDAFEKINSNFEKIKDNEIDILFEKPLANSERFDKNIERIKKHLSSLDENDFDAKAIYIGREIQANTTQIDQNKQAIKDLINTTDEKIKQDPKYLENLAKLEIQTVNLRNANVELNKELKNTARETMQEELNARKENLDLLKQENEEKDRAREREFQDREWAIEEQLAKLEKELYGGNKEDYEATLTGKNELLKQQSEEMQKQEDSLSKQADLQKKLLDLEKARQDLANAQKERNVRMYTGKGFEWVANPKDIESAQEKVTSLQEDYDKIVSDQAKETKKQQLENEIDANQKLIDEKSKAYEKQEKILNDSLNRDKKAYDKEKALRDRSIENTEIQLNHENQLIDTKLKELSVVYDNNWQSIINIYDAKLKMAEDIKAKMLTALTISATAITPQGSAISNVVSNDLGSNNTNTQLPSVDINNIKHQIGQIQIKWNNLNNMMQAGVGNQSDEVAMAMLHEQADTLREQYNLPQEDYRSFDTGGFTGNNEGLAILHKKELILNAEDSKNILNAVYASRDFNKYLPNTTTNSNNSHEQQINYNFHNVKVVSDNAEQFWKNIEGYAIKRR